jgi:uncharacterized protein (DUF111 family)
VRVLSSGPPPTSWVPLRSGFGAGTKDPQGRPNALRIVLADIAPREQAAVESLVQLATDIDDMDGEQLAGLADVLRASGALDVTLVPTLMKKGRPGTRVDVLATEAMADRLEEALFVHSTTIGVRRARIERHALPREERRVCVLDHEVRVKVVTLPGGGRRAKPEYEDVARVAVATGRALRDVHALARDAAEREVEERVSRPAGRDSPIRNQQENGR